MPKRQIQQRIGLGPRLLNPKNRNCSDLPCLRILTNFFPYSLLIPFEIEKVVGNLECQSHIQGKA